MFGSSVQPSQITWRVIRLGGPIPRAVGLVEGSADTDDEGDGADQDVDAYGVVISSDAMLQKTHTLLYCPLICGVRNGLLLQLQPWHVSVEIDNVPDSGRVDFSPIYMVTKVVLPISPNEVNPDGLDYGKLKEKSQREAAVMLKQWFSDIRS